MKGLLITLFSTILIISLAGCGGGGGKAATTTPAETLKLSVGNINIDSKSSITRLNKKISIASINNLLVDPISTNKSSDVLISGGSDAALFEIKKVSQKEGLYFKSIPDEYNPHDANADGKYEVDITANDNDGQSATIKIAYVITVPTSAKKILKGKTYYILRGTNKYQKIVFSDLKATTTDFRNGSVVSGSETTLADFTYNNTSISYTENGANVICSVIKKPELKLLCGPTTSSQNETKLLLTTPPEPRLPINYKVTSTQINNSPLPEPQISSFSLTGNKEINNGTAIISKSSFQGSFKFEANFGFLAKFVYVGLLDGDTSIYYELNGDTSLSVNCKYTGYDTGVKYSCNNINVSNDTGVIETTFVLLACRTDRNEQGSNCSKATIPVKFID